MATEDFSFPTFADTTSSAIDSPPLWRLSPAASPDSCHRTTKTEEEAEEEYRDCFPTHKLAQRKSLSCVELSGRGAKLNDEQDKHENMDMLWEDFNEKLSIKRRFGSDHHHHHHHHMINMGCAHDQLQSLRSSNKPSSSMVSPRKPAATSTAGFVVFMKALKKLFLLHNSHQPHISAHQSNRSRIRRVKKRSR